MLMFTNNSSNSSTTTTIKNDSQTSVGLAVTPGSKVLRLDKEMNKILNSSELDDWQKYSMYQQVLQRFLHYKQQSSDDDEAGNELLLPTVDKHCTLLLEMAMANVLPRLRQNARNLMNSLRRSGSIAWNKLGMITVDGVRARGVNIVDLVNEAVRRSKRPPSRSFDQFVCLLPTAVLEESNSSGNNNSLLTASDTSLLSVSGRQQQQLTSSGSASDEDDEDDKEEKDYDVEKTLDPNNLTFFKYRKRKRGGSSRAAVDTMVDASIRSVAPPARKQRDFARMLSKSSGCEEKSVASLPVLGTVGKITFDRVYRQFREVIKRTRRKKSPLTGSYLKGLFRGALLLVRCGAKIAVRRPFREGLSKRVRESGDNLKRKAEQIINKIMAPDEQKGEEVRSSRKKKAKYKKTQMPQKTQSDSGRGAGTCVTTTQKKKNRKKSTTTAASSAVAKYIFINGEMDLVIDLEFFKDYKGQVVPKEVGLAALDLDAIYCRLRCATKAHNTNGMAFFEIPNKITYQYKLCASPYAFLELCR
ncbi:hypothetical protein TSAR_015362 [Trichomalopsis sarcophagae]|uniref:Uncharacterized protein n=1 Tax=Trichomalopsis sarcophagae TaxID=543379 RepID=A0A232ESC5_9HYME|nr:hypothetical protein TSAR_015362 [Trichomalopsis sarcophagae]